MARDVLALTSFDHQHLWVLAAAREGAPTPPSGSVSFSRYSPSAPNHKKLRQHHNSNPKLAVLERCRITARDCKMREKNNGTTVSISIYSAVNYKKKESQVTVVDM